jgi:hypothetical protein
MSGAMDSKLPMKLFTFPSSLEGMILEMVERGTTIAAPDRIEASGAVYMNILYA